MTPDVARIRKTLLALAEQRGLEKTFCPSEAARLLGSPDWRKWMPAVRTVAADLVQNGDLRCTQSGREADPAQAKGPIRLGMAKR